MSLKLSLLLQAMLTGHLCDELWKLIDVEYVMDNKLELLGVVEWRTSES